MRIVAVLLPPSRARLSSTVLGSGAVPVVDVTCCPTASVPDGAWVRTRPGRPAPGRGPVVLAELGAPVEGRPTWLETAVPREIPNGFAGLVLKGREAGGAHGDEDGLALLAACPAPDRVILDAGLGPRTAAAAVALGAGGVWLDAQHLATPEMELPDPLRARLQLAGDELTSSVSGWRVANPLTAPVLRALATGADPWSHPDAWEVGLKQGLWPVGQGLALARGLADRHGTLVALLRAYVERVQSPYVHVGESRVAAPGPVVHDLDSLRAEGTLAGCGSGTGSGVLWEVAAWSGRSVQGGPIHAAVATGCAVACDPVEHRRVVEELAVRGSARLREVSGASPASTPAATNASVLEPIAVIGMGCRFPDAPDVDAFWKNLVEGRCSIREVPADRWDPALYWDPDPKAPDRTYSKIGAFLSDHRFRPRDFRIPPAVAQQLDPVQQITLAAVRDALKDAGLQVEPKGDGAPFDRARCGVMLGNSLGGEITDRYSVRLAWPQVRAQLSKSPAFQALSPSERDAELARTEAAYKHGLPEVTEDSMPGELSNVIAGRVANAFDLGGANFTVDAACASSMAALDNAVKALRNGELDLVITGGADRSMGVPTFVKFSKIGALSPDHSAPFDASANGFVMGEGCGILVLERLSDAVAARRRIYAVIEGIGASSDGKGKGITAPNPRGQLLALKRAYEGAGVDPREVDLVECHGTSTVVGDQVEVECLAEVLGKRPVERGPVRIGSVKSNIGHLKSAAGAASCIKAGLALHHRVFPPSLGVKSPRRDLPLDRVPLQIQTRAEPWPEREGRVRRCGVSAFGFGGTNFHVLMAEAPREQPPLVAAVPVPSRSPVPSTRVPEAPAAGDPVRISGLPEGVWLVTARSTDELLERLRAFRSGESPRFADGDPVRIAAAADTRLECEEQLDRAIALFEKGGNPDLLRARGIHVEVESLGGQVAFLFTGQGSQYLDMGLDLAGQYPVVAETFAEADRVLLPILGRSVTSLIRCGEGEDKALCEERLKATEFSQPATLTVDVALARLLAAYGVWPDVVAGHSLGEYAACVAAGVLTFPQALEAVSARGREMASIQLDDPGKMAGISTSTAVVEEVLAEIDGYVVPANKNCPSQTVIAGSSEAVDAAVEAFAARGIGTQILPVSHAFHSRIVAPASGPLRQVLRRLGPRPPIRPITTNVDAERYPSGPDEIVDVLARQLASPVEWVAQIERMHAEGVRSFVECGPKRALTGFTVSILKRRPHRAWATNHPKLGGVKSFRDALAGLLAAGFTLNERPEGAVDLLALQARPAAPETEPVPEVGRRAPLVADDVVQRFLASAASAASEDLDAERFATALFPAVQQLLQLAFESAAVSRRVSAAQPPSEPVEEPTVTARSAAAGTVAASQTVLIEAPRSVPEIVCSGASVGLPGGDEVFSPKNIPAILRGENRIGHIGDYAKRFLDLSLVRLVKDSSSGRGSFLPVRSIDQVIRLAGRSAGIRASDFGIPDDLTKALDVTTQLAIAAGLLALDDAGIPLVQTFRETASGRRVPAGWKLPEPLRDDTGIVFGSAFPGYDSLARHLRTGGDDGEGQFDRRFLFQILCFAHAQFAQFIGARGPNTSVNAACASATQAVAVAEDWIRVGRCRRVVVITADDVTSDELLRWIGGGFMAAGAATTHDVVEEAALPFDARRHGMILGMGAASLVIERADDAARRGVVPVARLLGTEIVNSAFHGTRLDGDHIGRTVSRTVERVARENGTSPAAMASSLLFVSHETYTPAQGGSAAAEIASLRHAFGASAAAVVVANTKGFTGHAMGAGIEDVVALKALQYGRVPPIANLAVPDPDLGDLSLSRGEERRLRYALRFAAGFGSQLALSLWEARAVGDARVADQGARAEWIHTVVGAPAVREYRDQRTRRVEKATEDDLLEPGQPVDWSEAVEERPSVVVAPLVAAAAVSATAAVSTVSSSAVLSELLGIIADKTGYAPADLEVDFELEADLGIDTVKQAEILSEVQSRFGLETDPDLRLSTYRTISSLAAYLSGRLERADAETVEIAGPEAERMEVEASATGPAEVGSLPAAPPMEQRKLVDAPKRSEVVPLGSGPAPAMADEDSPTARFPAHTIPPMAPPERRRSPEPPAEPTYSPPVAQAEDDTYEVLVGVVAELTGYARADLEPGFELEADLGIDTVKQAEVLARMQKRYGISRDEDFRLSEHPTLRALADYLSARRQQVAVAIGEDLAEAVADLPTVAEERVAPSRPPVHPMPVMDERAFEVVEPRASPTPRAATPRAARPRESTPRESAPRAAEPQPIVKTPLPESFRIRRPILVDQSAVRRWSLEGWGVLVLGRNALAAAVGDALQSRGARRTGPFDAVVDLSEDVLLAFDTARELDTARPRRWLCVTRLGGFGREASDRARAFLDGARAGFAKALGREWPDLSASVLDAAPSAHISEVVDWVCEELLADGPDEVFRSGIRRRVVQLRTEPLPVPARTPQGAVLITGGARGVGARIALALARRGPVKLALVGRGPAGEAPLDVAKETARIRAQLERGGRVTPAAVTAQLAPLQRAEEVRRTLATLQAEGASVRYFRRDVGDEGEVKALIEDVQRAFGPIAWVIHGAGVEESRLLSDKDRVAFSRVFEGKARGGKAMLDQLSADTRILSMGSVAGRFGNSGQVDYAAANEALARMCGARPGALHVDWTAWDDVGMAVRGGMKSLLQQRGVDLLPADAGAELAIDLLSAGVEGEVVVAGRFGDLQPPPHHPLLDRVELDGDTVRGFRDLSLQKDPWLGDHVIEGNPVLPGVVGLELMAAVASLVAPGQAVVGADDLVFEAPVKVYKDQNTLVVVEALPEQPGRVSVRLSSVRALATGTIRRTEHFRAVLWMGFAPDSGPLPSALMPDEMLGASDIYARFFHGPRFQVLVRVTAIAADGLLAEAAVDDRLITPRCVTTPMALESAFQAAGLHGMITRGVMGLPERVSELRLLNPVGAAEDLCVTVRAHRGDPQKGVVSYDMDVDGKRGPVLRVRGFTTSSLGPLRPEHRFPDPPSPRPDGFPPSTPDGPQVARVSYDDASLWLSPAEMDELKRRGTEGRVRDRIAGRAAAKRAVHELTGTALDAIAIESRASGEPSVRIADGRREVHVSVSHRDGVGMALAAFDRVGVDFEAVDVRSEAFLRTWFSAGERALVGSDALLATVVWSAKEAVLKALGVGLSISAADVEIMAIAPGTAAVQVRGEALRRLVALGAAHPRVTWISTGDGEVVATARLRAEAA